MTTTTKAPMIDQGFADKGVRHRPRQTHCKRGHERTPENLTRGGDCAVCRRAWYQAKNAERRAERAHDRAVAHIRHAHTVAGLQSFLRRREERGVPAGGWQVAE